MSVLTPEEIKLLKDSGNEGLAAVALKLESTNYVPQSRLNEVIDKAKTYESELATLKAAKDADEVERLKKQGEYKTLAEQEKADKEKALKERDELKPLADQYTELKSAKAAQLKESLGEDYLPEYDSLSLVSIEKLLAKKQTAPPNTENAPPGKVKGNNPFSRATLNYTAQIELMKTNPALYAKLKAEAQ